MKKTVLLYIALSMILLCACTTNTNDNINNLSPSPTAEIQDDIKNSPENETDEFSKNY